MSEQNKVELPQSIANECNAIAQRILGISNQYTLLVNDIKEKDAVIADLKEQLKVKEEA